MRRNITARYRLALPVFTVVAAVLSSGLTAVAAPSSPVPHYSTRADTPPVENVFPGIFEADQRELVLAAEEACTKGQLDQRECGMSAEQIRKLPSDIEREVRDEVRLVTTDPQARAMAGGARGVGDVAKILTRLTQVSKNPAVQKLTDRASQFADYASRATTAGAALAENTAVEYAKAAISLTASLVPPVGDLMSLGEAISNGNVEQGVVAVIGLAATAIGVSFPPAGAVIAVGVAIYSVGKFLWSYFMAKPRDWIADPPRDSKELFDRGASIKWEERKVGDKTANVIFSETQLVALQTLLLDSQWADNTQRPVEYTIPDDAEFYRTVVLVPGASDIVVIVWQGGHASTSTCVRKDGNVSVFACSKLAPKVTIGQGRPATLEVRYLVQDYQQLNRMCRPRPCVVPESFYAYSGSRLLVRAEGSREVGLLLPFSVGLV